MGLKLTLLGFVIALSVVALSLPQPILIAAAIVSIIGIVLLFLDK